MIHDYNTVTEAAYYAAVEAMKPLSDDAVKAVRVEAEQNGDGLIVDAADLVMQNRAEG